jgi:hypothetical protein
MQFQLNTDNTLRASEALTQRMQADVDAELGRFAPRLTRVEMHLGDLNGSKSGTDKRCQVEARLAGRAPVSVHHVADTIDAAVSGALAKMTSALDHAIGKLGAGRRGASRAGAAPAEPVDGLAPGVGTGSSDGADPIAAAGTGEGVDAIDPADRPAGSDGSGATDTGRARRDAGDAG